MAMPARPGAITGPSIATCALICYYCTHVSPQAAAGSAPQTSPLLVHIVRLILG
ncbi:unnamed protein product, partial [Tilletia caries]